jgi:hypothetical protein
MQGGGLALYSGRSSAERRFGQDEIAKSACLKAAKTSSGQLQGNA